MFLTSIIGDIIKDAGLDVFDDYNKYKDFFYHNMFD